MAAEPRIFIAGHQGMVGSAIMRALHAKGYKNLVTRSHSELDLTDQAAVRAFFQHERIEQVYLAAAKVGGIYANKTYPAEFIYQNLMIQTNVIHESWKAGVQKLLFLGSSCIYPRDCQQPIKEEYLLTGPLEETNHAYSIAKIAGIETCRTYNRQYGTRFLSVMPTNLYGPGDNYDLESCHVLPALIRKVFEAKVANAPEIVIWGSGMPRREFLHVDDLANACVLLARLPETTYQELLDDTPQGLINVGYGNDISIEALAKQISTIIGYAGEIVKDRSKPDGTPRKLLDSSRVRSLGWSPLHTLEQGLSATYKAFLHEVGLRPFS